MERTGDDCVVDWLRATGRYWVWDGRWVHVGLGDSVGEQVTELGVVSEILMVDSCWSVLNGAVDEVQDVAGMVVRGHSWTDKVVMEKLGGIREQEELT
jgi:hypothetical protein